MMTRSTWWTLATMAAAVVAASCCAKFARAAAPNAGATVLVTQDASALRAGPSVSAAVQTSLWRGEALELRGERGDYAQVWDHDRERGGWVDKSQFLRIDGASTRELAAMLALVRDTPGAEGMGLGIAAAAIQGAPTELLTAPEGASLLDAVGRLAERLADRASAGAPDRAQEQAALSASLDVAARYGVRIHSREIDGRMRYCYDGDAFVRVLSLKSADAEQKVRAALALTRSDCRDPTASPRAREEADQWSAELLDRVGDGELAPVWKSRLATRRAALWSSLAFAKQRRGQAAAAQRAVAHALADLASARKADLVDADLVLWNQAAVRLNAVRWANAAGPTALAEGPGVQFERSADGQTCITLVDPRLPASAPAPAPEAGSGSASGSAPAAKRCTWGVAWEASVRINPQRNAITLAVQPRDGWTELWVFRRQGERWSVSVLPPAALDPGFGYAEFAGWVPGGRQMLVAREALAQGRTVRRFEVLALDSLVAERTAFEPDALGAFSRWGDPQWRDHSLALR